MLVADAEHIKTGILILGKLKVTDTLKKGCQELATLGNSAAKTWVVSVEVGKQPFHIALTCCSDSTLLKSMEVVGKRSVEFGIALCLIRHIYKQMRRQDEETLCIDNLLSGVLSHIIRHIGIVRIRHSGIPHQVVTVVDHILRDKTVEKTTQHKIHKLDG